MMTSKTIILSSLAVSTLMLSACGSISSITGKKNKNLDVADYWQRSSASSSLYLQGPKAQQILHQDLARCTAEIKELQRLGQIRNAIPANHKGGHTSSGRSDAQAQMDAWESPQRDGYLHSEHLEYADFESCMVSKGWERAEYLPHGEAKKARQDYLNNTSQQKKDKNSARKDRENVTSVIPPAPKPGSFDNLND